VNKTLASSCQNPRRIFEISWDH